MNTLLDIDELVRSVRLVRKSLETGGHIPTAAAIAELKMVEKKLESALPPPERSTYLYAALVELGYRIEECGASPALTHAVTLCSDLRASIGNQSNMKDAYAEARVLVVLNGTKRLHGFWP